MRALGLSKKMLFFTLTLVVIILVAAFVTIESFTSKVEASGSPFYVGIEFGYGNATDCKTLIDKVANYTNLLVISSPSITTNEVILNDTCDYAYTKGMNIIIYFPQMDPISSSAGSFHPYIWAMKAKDTYGTKFLGLYIYDEVGGEVLDNYPGHLNVNYVTAPNAPFSTTAVDYKTASDNFVTNARNQMDAFTYCAKKTGTSVMTADYGLYWWDYKAGYDTVFAEFGWGNNHQLAIDLCRGAATVQNKDWGAIICWENQRTDMAGSLENGTALYDDLTLAYDNGAKYAIIFDYAGNNQPNPFESGILDDEHFDALQNFWTYIQQNPDKHGSITADTALVLPQGYGFGFRFVNDKIWGLDQADYWTSKIWNDTNNLVSQYAGKLDIVFSDPEFQDAIAEAYTNVIPWSSGATLMDYPVLDLNSTIGYPSIQQALASGATSAGDTVYVKSGTYGSVTINKPVTLLGENMATTIIDGGNLGSALRIVGTSGVKVSGFTIRNGNTHQTAGASVNNTQTLLQLLQQYGISQSMLAGLNSSMIATLTSSLGLQALGASSMSAGVLMSNANNCTLSDNIVANNTYGVILSSSTNNTLTNNRLTGNKYSFGVTATAAAQYSNTIDISNTIEGKPILYLVNKSNLTVPSNAGSVALINCTKITVQNMTLSNNYNGLLIVNTKDSTIAGNTISGNIEGLKVQNSFGNSFQDNIITDNTCNLNYTDNSLPNSIDSSNTVNGQPICIWYGEQDKTVPANAGYVALFNCTRINVENLSINNGQGLLIQNSTYCTLANNKLNNLSCAIQLKGSSNNIVTENIITASQDGIIIENSTANNVNNNTINGCKNSGITVANSTTSTIAQNILSSDNKGILIKDSAYNILSYNKLSQNTYALEFTVSPSSMVSGTLVQGGKSTGNTIIGNTLNQNQRGVSIVNNVFSNSFYQNNFVGNVQQAYTQSSGSTSTSNKWDNGAQGNYWSNYNGTDANHDGIGDQPMNVYQTSQSQPYGSSLDVDRHPLMSLFIAPVQ